MPARSCTEPGAATGSSIDRDGIETSTAFRAAEHSPDAAKTLREFASQVVDAEDGGM
jgi:hypothetical protein